MTTEMYSTGAYLQRNPTWHTEHSPWKASKVIEMLEHSKLRPSTVCEIGCGAGEILRQLQSKLGDECELTGFDVSPQAYELCKSRANQRLRFVLGSPEDDDTIYDLVLVMDVIEHLEDYYTFLRMARARARHMVIHIPLDMCVNHLIRAKPLADLRRVVGHIHSFTMESALAVLRETGFRVLAHRYTAWSLELPPKSWRRRVLRVPRRVAYSVSPDLTVRLLGGFSLMVLAEPAEQANVPVRI